MKQSVARTLIIVSLVLSMISFILSLIALYLPRWKYVQLPLTSSEIISVENKRIDPLIRGELEKYTDILFQKGQIHSFGLSSHCIVGSQCGQNLLPSFQDTDYTFCHHIKYHRECIFSHSISSLDKCYCEKPSYIGTIHTLLILTIVLEILFFIVNILRLNHYIPCLNDIQLRLTATVSILFSSLFLLVIIIQHRNYQSYESLIYFETMREHYSRRQIYPFAQDLEVIIKQILSNLEIQSGASFLFIVFVFIFTIISFFTSSTVEIKEQLKFDEDEKKTEQNHVLISTPATMDRFIPYEQIRFPRQTKV
ncbi:hypothetical protein I4U23_012883 [Adineta vaga]|nr:hypothetical protein I4U23_012883 [Adineta vaga]